MPVKVMPEDETVEKIYAIAKAKGVDFRGLFEILTEHHPELVSILVEGPFVRKKGDTLERYFLVDGVDVVTQIETKKWVVDSVKIA